MKQLSPLDAAFVYLETPSQYMHVAGLALYDPSTVPLAKKRQKGNMLGHKDIMQEYEKALHLIPHMRRKLAMVPGNIDHPWWVEDRDFDIEFHLRHIALPHPGDWRQLCIQVARLHSRGLDMTRPLWESYIIENLDNIPGLPPGAFAVLNKVHHAAIDGATGAAQAIALHTFQPDEELPAPKDHWRPEEEPAPGVLLARAWFNSVTAPIQATQVIRRVASQLNETGFSNFANVWRSNVQSPQTIFNRRISPHRVFDGRTFSLNSLKAIYKALPGAKLNDVAVTIIAGALREYLLERGNMPETSLTAFMPINARTEEERLSGGNVVSGMTAPIGTHIANPKERLKYVCKQTAYSKEATVAVGARNLMDLISLTPAMMTSLISRTLGQGAWQDYIPPFANLVITNVPGSPIDLYSTGARLMANFGLGPNLHGQGLFFCVQSHRDVVTVGFNACRRMIPDPETLAEHIRKSEAALVRAVLGRTEVNIADVADLLRATATREDQQEDQRKGNGAELTAAPRAKTSTAKPASKAAKKPVAGKKSQSAASRRKPVSNGKGTMVVS